MMAGYVKKTFFIAVLFFIVITFGIYSNPSQAKEAAAKTGRLYLVSMGIGDPDNITVRAQKTISEADIFFSMRPERTREQYAGLVKDKEIYEAGHRLFVDRGPRGSMGKDKNQEFKKRMEKMKAMEDKNRKIIREAVGAGKTVVILDSGDPTIYGPHTGYMKEFADLNPEIITGVSSFNAANAALLRGVAEGSRSHSVIITAAMSADKNYKGTDSLSKLAETQSTMVFFTMRLDLPEVVEQLKTQYPGDTPIAIVLYAGYREKEKVVKATLDTIVKALGSDRLPFEHLIYVGDFMK